jgi:hypothetical protein
VVAPADVLLILDALIARGVHGPVRVGDVQCVLPAPAAVMKPIVDEAPPTRGQMLEFFEGGGAPADG